MNLLAIIQPSVHTAHKPYLAVGFQIHKIGITKWPPSLKEYKKAPKTQTQHNTNLNSIENNKKPY